MGQSQSSPERRDVPIEQLSHELALRFADKCYSHLEVAHFKDNFKILADHKDGIEYWKEETLCRFLSLPESLSAGPVIYQMSTYLGSFPFPSLAPCILTREAMLKVVTILTGRYKKVLRRGGQDKSKLLFRSMAVFDRRMSVASPRQEKFKHETDSPRELRAPNSGFAIDEPTNDAEEEEDDDDLALAALDALDAIEVFKEDQKKERKISQAHIPPENFQKLIMVILLFAPITPLDNIASLSISLDSDRMEALSSAAKAMVATFNMDAADRAIRYSAFMKIMTVTMPYLFRPLSPLFEHFLFSKNIDLSKHTGPPLVVADETHRKPESSIHTISGGSQPAILNDIILAQLSASIEVGTTAATESSSLFHSGTRFDELYSTASHGTSLSSFSRQILSWKSATLLMLSGTVSDVDEPVIIGAYLPEPWKENATHPSDSEANSQTVLFQLKPYHAIFRANKYNKSTPFSYFSSRSGIALGCVVPTQSRLQTQHQKPVPGPVSLLIDEDMSGAIFQHDGDAGIGAFMTDPRLEEAQRSHETAVQPKRITIEIDSVEVWGVSAGNAGEDAIENQKKRLAWEEAEAARRRGVNFGGDKDGARHLLEMAGIVGQNQSGGSV